ncbi:uncharacterized protein [Chelonus insularis]|uniref:uncharacterized protein n=1 Tax=Chelonus insularis TaxID=460826 RepID=UPI001589A326|nr:uncharacterized protein LOC118070853 [Chelonus insularis]
MKAHEKYKSYKDFCEALEKYKKDKKVNFTLKNTKKLKNCYMNGKKRDMVAEGYNEELVYYEGTLQCSRAKTMKCNAQITFKATDKNHLEIRNINDKHSELCIEANAVEKVEPLKEKIDDEIDQIVNKIKHNLRTCVPEDRKTKINDCRALLDQWEKNDSARRKIDDKNLPAKSFDEQTPSTSSKLSDCIQSSPHRSKDLWEGSFDEQTPSTSAKLSDCIQSSPHGSKDLWEGSFDEEILSSAAKLSDSLQSSMHGSKDLWESSFDEQVALSIETSANDPNHLEEQSSKQRISTAQGSMVKAFDSLTDDEKIRKMLSWLSVPEVHIENVLQRKCLLRSPQFTHLSDSFRDEDVIKCFNSLVVTYVEENTFNLLTKMMSAMKKKKSWSCNTCKKTIKKKSIQCDACKLWYDFACVGITEATKDDWFCKTCLN